MHRMGASDRSSNNRCESCIKLLKWIPVLFILALVGWSYYAYVVELCIKSVDSVFVQVIFLFFYHIIGFLFLWSYWKTTCTPIGTVPAKWRLMPDEIDELMDALSLDDSKAMLQYYARDLPVSNRTSNGAIRFCDKCKIIKPDRAHHCSVCGCCVLKMDHHCPWVNNCVNFTNYKYFVLFLGYALLYCIYVALTSVENFIKFWQGELNITGMGRFHILFLFFVAVMFAISLISLFGYHIYLVLYNRTTLEAFRAPIFHGNGPDKNGYNLGKLANFKEVFGDNWKLWFFPVFTSKGDGLRFQLHQKHQESGYKSMGNTPTRLDSQQESNEQNLNLVNNHITNFQNNHQHNNQIIINIENTNNITNSNSNSIQSNKSNLINITTTTTTTTNTVTNFINNNQEQITCDNVNATNAVTANAPALIVVNANDNLQNDKYIKDNLKINNVNNKTNSTFSNNQQITDENNSSTQKSHLFNKPIAISSTARTNTTVIDIDRNQVQNNTLLIEDESAFKELDNNRVNIKGSMHLNNFDSSASSVVDV